MMYRSALADWAEAAAEVDSAVGPGRKGTAPPPRKLPLAKRSADNQSKQVLRLGSQAGDEAEAEGGRRGQEEEGRRLAS